jgi:hypothetical protein
MKIYYPAVRAALVVLTIAAARVAGAADAVQFTYQPPQVGQVGSHDMQFSLQMNMSLRQAGQNISSEQQEMSRAQDRQVTVLQVSEGKVTKVQVKYPKAWEEVSHGKLTGLPQTEPIEGKTYTVERRGTELVITDEQGKDVPEEERVLVAASMDAIGHPNPLGMYLNGKKIAVGQTLKLPNDMAGDLLGVKEAGGEAQKVELTLNGIQQDEDRRVANFAMLVVLKLPGGGNMDVKGQLQLDPETCQVAAASFNGPVSMHEDHGPKGHTFEVVSEGTMTVAVKSHYFR